MPRELTPGYHWIEGLLLVGKRQKEKWVPIYNYTDRRLAKAHLGLIINEQGNPRELATLEDFDDFRIRQDDPYDKPIWENAPTVRSIAPSGPRAAPQATTERVKAPARGKIGKKGGKAPKGRHK